MNAEALNALADRVEGEEPSREPAEMESTLPFSVWQFPIMPEYLRNRLIYGRAAIEQERDNRT